MFNVSYIYNGNEFFLRNTIWTAHQDRATPYTTAEAAKAALAKRHELLLNFKGISKTQAKQEAATATLKPVEA